MATLDGVVGIKQITTDEAEPVPTRGTLHVAGPTALVIDDPENNETILHLAAFEGTTASAITVDDIDDDFAVFNYEGLDLASVVRLEITQSVAFDGMEPPTLSGNPRKTLLLRGDSVGRLELKHASSGAPANKRWACPGGDSYYLAKDCSIDVLYDATSQLWRVVP